jgi:hypothetical protein
MKKVYSTDGEMDWKDSEDEIFLDLRGELPPDFTGAVSYYEGDAEEMPFDHLLNIEHLLDYACELIEENVPEDYDLTNIKFELKDKMKLCALLQKMFKGKIPTIWDVSNEVEKNFILVNGVKQ